MLAGLALRLGQVAQAITHFRELVRLRPHSREDRQALAKLLEKDDPQSAIDLLIQTPRQHIDAPLRLWLADLYHRTGRARDAEDAFAALLASDTQDASLWRQAGILADEAGADALACRRLTRATNIEAKRRTKRKTTPNPLSLHALALVHLHAGRFTQAGYCFWRVTRQLTTSSKSEIPQAWAGVAVCALATDHLRLAQRASQQLAAHADAGQRRELLAALWQHVAVGRAICHAGKAVEAAAIDSNTNGSRDSGIEAGSAAPAGEQPPAAMTSSLHDLLKRAVATLEAQAGSHPNRADTQYHLAQCHVALGNTSAASRAAHAALAINPNYAAAASLDARLRHAQLRAA
jgi:tetratricopeptide (TPR) repeat protein